MSQPSNGNGPKQLSIGEAVFLRFEFCAPSGSGNLEEYATSVIRKAVADPVLAHVISSTFDSTSNSREQREPDRLFVTGLSSGFDKKPVRPLPDFRNLEQSTCLSKRSRTGLGLQQKLSECSTSSMVMTVRNPENLKAVASSLAAISSSSQFSCFEWITEPMTLDPSMMFSIHPGTWSGPTVSLTTIERSMRLGGAASSDFPSCPRIATFQNNPSETSGMGRGSSDGRNEMGEMGAMGSTGMGGVSQSYVLDLTTECSGSAAATRGSFEQVTTCSRICDFVHKCAGFSMDLEHGFCVLFKERSRHSCVDSVTAQPPKRRVMPRTLSALNSRNCGKVSRAVQAASTETVSRTFDDSEYAVAAPESTEGSQNISANFVDWLPASDELSSIESSTQQPEASTDGNATADIPEQSSGDESADVREQQMSSLEVYSRAVSYSTYSVDADGICATEVSACEGDAECSYWLHRVQFWAQSSLAKGNPVSMQEYITELKEEMADVSDTAAVVAVAMIDCLIANANVPICPRQPPTEGSSCLYSAASPLSCGYDPDCCECANVQPICVNGTFAECSSNGLWTIHKASITCATCPKCTTFDWRFVGSAVDISSLPTKPMIPGCNFTQTGTYGYRASHFYLSKSCTGQLAVPGSMLQKKACQYLCSSISSCKSWTLHVTTGHCYIFQDTSCGATGCSCSKCSCLSGQCYFQSNDNLYTSGHSGMSCVSDFATYVATSSASALTAAATSAFASSQSTISSTSPASSCAGCPQDSWCIKGTGLAAACVTCESGSGCDVPVLYGRDTGLSFVCKTNTQCSTSSSKLQSNSGYLSVVTTEFSNSNGFDSTTHDLIVSTLETLMIQDVQDHGSNVRDVVSSVGTHGTRLIHSFLIESSDPTAYAFDSTALTSKIADDLETRIGQDLESSHSYLSIYSIVSKALESSSSNSQSQPTVDYDSVAPETSDSSGSSDRKNQSNAPFIQSPAFIMLSVCLAVVVLLGISYFRSNGSGRYQPQGYTEPSATRFAGVKRSVSASGGVLDDNGRHLYGTVENNGGGEEAAANTPQQPTHRAVKVARNSLSVRTSSKVQRISDKSILLKATKKIVPEGSTAQYSKVSIGDGVDEDLLMDHDQR